MNTHNNNSITGRQVLLGILNGVKMATEAIKTTYGPKGTNAIIEHTNYPYHIICNDAQSIIQALQFDYPLEKQGLMLLKELSDKANKDSGDGRKTTILIAEAILQAGVDTELSGLEIKNALDKTLPDIIKEIDKVKEAITINEVHKVASIAGESEEIGNLIGEIYKKIGVDGDIQLENSGTYDTTYTITDGIRFQRTGFLSPFMVHGSKTEAIYEKPTILVTKRKISSIKDIDPLILSLDKIGKRDLIIFTDDMDSNVASIMIETHKMGVFNICIIKAPVLWKNYIFEDFAKSTGSTIIEEASGLNLGKSLPMDALGTCDKIIIDKDEVRIIGGADITEHIKNLQEQTDDDSKLRLSWLKTKTAVMLLGAGSESELSYKRMKTLDALCSARLALEDGVVEGGGICLQGIPLKDTLGGRIMSIALSAPFKAIIDSGVKSVSNFGIVDSASVIKNAVKNAVSIASTILTVSVAISLPKRTPEEMQLEILQAKRMPM